MNHLDRIRLELDIISHQLSDEEYADFLGEVSEECASREVAIREEL